MVKLLYWRYFYRGFMDTRGGIDSDGFIATLSDELVQPEFQVLLHDVCAVLVAHVEPLLDGIYLYGSVARGSAKLGFSDLDVTLVLRCKPSSLDRQKIESLRCILQDRHTEVTKIDFDIGSRAEALAPDNLFSWGYWLKHHCRCLWGNDLGEHFEPFRPSRAIALALNGDFHRVLTKYARRIKQENAPAETQRLQREASRKLIRSTNILRVDQDQAWPQTLEDHVELFIQHHPLMEPQINFFLVHARNPTAPVDEFVTQLQGFIRWMDVHAPPS
ncbi:nucleotidyltransferase domain-containing protein [Cupriavidus basilensis]|uniref:Nucleotidyltransferase domain-containing protein n=1 Tax=Cupriavidus basilensis TaxID=68895 RepID=A0ABT6AIU5_9BURK|nr:nucleotidyltransferase domain-containing protein [Cupriavidus basilensis]MDF3832519.1 nucleotidyltransferase domain-containing protein [Cupriavidus basilensis]